MVHLLRPLAPMNLPVTRTSAPELLAWNIRGIPLLVSPSWLAALAATTLTFGLGMHVLVPLMSIPALAGLGLTLACAFSAALVLHEYAHAVVAERKGLGVEHIRLFGGGALCLRRDAAQEPGQQFAIAAAGPLASTAMSLGSIALALGLGLFDAKPIAAAGLWLFAFTNLLIAITNLLPVFPFDGGKLLHALLWRRARDHRVAAIRLERCGREFSRVVVALGVLFMAFSAELIMGGLVILFGIYLMRLPSPLPES